jgi:uncharacterized glyoxalase superfamily protein PhnB
VYNPDRGYPSIVPYLLYHDLTAAARWLEDVLGAKEAIRFTAPDGEPGHIEMLVGRQVLMLGRGGSHFGETASITLVFVDDVDRACSTGAEAGGQVLEAPVDQPWGLRQAVVADPEGQRWEVSAYVRPVSPETWGAAQLVPMPWLDARPQPLITVTDVEASSRWYQHLLGAESAHGGPEYERLMSGGELVLQLHHWDVDHHHGAMGDPNDRPYGNGVLLWFAVSDFDDAVIRAGELQADVVLEAHINPSAQHREIWLHDPDGYVVVLASPAGETAAAY